MNTYKVNKKNNGFGDGFTLVEVIISIVVIVIIASITLISYVGVQNQSKAEKTRTNAGTVKKVAEALLLATSTDAPVVLRAYTFTETVSPLRAATEKLDSVALAVASTHEPPLVLYRTI